MEYFFNGKTNKIERHDLLERVIVYQNNCDIRLVKKGDFYNYVDKSDNIISKEWFLMANDFHFGIALVRKKDGLYYYLRKDGRFLNEKGYLNAYDFKLGVGKVKFDNCKYNYIKEDGEYLLMYNLHYAGDFKDGIATIAIGEDEYLYNYIKTNGKLVSPNEWFLNASDFSCGIGIVKRIVDDGKLYYFLKKDGNFLREDGVSCS